MINGLDLVPATSLPRCSFPCPGWGRGQRCRPSTLECDAAWIFSRSGHGSTLPAGGHHPVPVPRIDRFTQPRLYSFPAEGLPFIPLCVVAFSCAGKLYNREIGRAHV